jgi:dTDP-4-dehydrorhamnose reductase
MKKDKAKLLITGSNGMLGKDILTQLRPYYDLYVLNRKPDDLLEESKNIICDLEDNLNLAKNLRELSPDILIHAAAMVDIEKCQDDKEKCYKINYLAIVNLIENLPNDTLFIFVSTDSVFDGSVKFPIESSRKNTLNYYSETKSLAEDFIINNHENHIIIRTNMYGFHKNWRGSIVEWAISSLNKGIPFGGYYDVTFNPLYTRQISKIIQVLIDENFRGIIHLGSSSSLTKYEFLYRICELLKLNSSLLYKTSIDLEDGALRPKHTSLSISKLSQFAEQELFSLDKGLALLKEDLEIYWRIHNDN